MEKFGSFYNESRKTLFNYLMRMTGDHYLAGDIMQESFTRYLENYSEQLPWRQPNWLRNIADRSVENMATED